VDALARLIEAYGVAARPLRHVVALLTERPYPLDELVRATAVPRRTVEEVLTALGDDLAEGRIRPELVEAYRDRFGYAQLRATTLADPLDARVTDDLLTDAEELIAAAPRPAAALDHVAATAPTAVRRALWLDGAYDLAGAHLLCLGDHDLTALLVARVNPAVRITVVDIDERILEYVDTVAAARGLPIRCLYADLRFGLPGPAIGTADLVFTDPPYTPDGVRLFLARGLRALRDREHGRLLLAYGYSDRHPALGWQVQQAAAGLGLAFEAILPGFSRYHGAQAVGSASDLYVCRPTTRSWTGASMPVGLGIYTHGPQSGEAAPARTAAESLRALDALAGPDPVRVGPGARLALGAVLAAGRPVGDAVAVDLADDPGAWLLRVLLAVNAARLAVLVPNRHPDVSSQRGQQELAGLVRAKYRLTYLRNTPDSRYTVVVGERVEPGQELAGRLHLHLLDRAHGKLGNVWRDGLVRVTDGALTRQAARERVGSDPDATLLDLPRHRLARVLDQASASVTSTLPSMAAE
jgi:predicted methyltransferase